MHSSKMKNISSKSYSDKKGKTLNEIYPKGSLKNGVASVSDPSRYGNKKSNDKVSVFNIKK